MKILKNKDTSSEINLKEITCIIIEEVVDYHD